MAFLEFGLRKYFACSILPDDASLCLVSKWSFVVETLNEWAEELGTDTSWVSKTDSPYFVVQTKLAKQCFEQHGNQEIAERVLTNVIKMSLRLRLFVSKKKSK